ncbi:lytic murein transglycosylase [Alteromonas facilis]|uniref:lytic murein transglycosylase n=1 Tax=Alteromonas facilis TaxID=2048004 RepID=UPI000C28C2D8|nr:lytic murein transglycosylase [Alteromonas facilis]
MRKTLASLAAALFFSSPMGWANDSLNFDQCLSRFGDLAKQQGVSEQTQQLIPSFKLQQRVLELDRSQPEFVQTFPAYFSKRVNDWRINKGREMLAKHADFLRQLTHQHGIPGHYLVAFWGLETNFGGYKGTMPILDSLATLACDQRRQQFFTQELLLALKLVDREKLNPDNMKGSWAGAMGHTQFMPSTYTQYAIDGDDDGTIDLFNSEQDALASAANFLARLGWQPGSRWGREVQLAEGFDYSLAGKKQRRSVNEWRELGVLDAQGNPLPDSELIATLRVPSGHQGPKFLTYQNFSIILRWNNSEFYAIAVGHLADRIVKGAPLATRLPDIAAISRVDIRSMQQQLIALGFDVGGADGIIGPATRAGIRAYQASQGLIADGFPSPTVRQHIAAQFQHVSTGS